MIVRAGLLAAAIAVVACSPAAPQASLSTVSPSVSPATARPSSSSIASPSLAQPTPLAPTDPPPYRGAVVAVYTVLLNNGISIHVLTDSAGALADHLLAASGRGIGILDAQPTRLLLIDSGPDDSTDLLETLDLTSGARNGIVDLRPEQLKAQGPIGGVLSPDGSQVAVGVAHALFIYAVATGASRLLAAAPSISRWLLPLRWTAAGITMSEVPYEGPAYDIVRVDPTSRSSTVVFTPTPSVVVSPDGGTAVVASNVNLGDGQSVRFPWYNTLTEQVGSGPATQVFQERTRNLEPFDVDNSGRTLFGSDGDSNTPTAVDMGVYLAVGGRATQQLPSTFYGEWIAAAFVDPSTALLSRIVGGGLDSETAAELDVVHLCPDAAATCRVTTVKVSSTPGSWPTVVGRIFVVGSIT